MFSKKNYFLFCEFLYSVNDDIILSCKTLTTSIIVPILLFILDSLSKIFPLPERLDAVATAYEGGKTGYKGLFSFDSSFSFSFSFSFSSFNNSSFTSFAIPFISNFLYLIL